MAIMLAGIDKPYAKQHIHKIHMYLQVRLEKHFLVQNSVFFSILAFKFSNAVTPYILLQPKCIN